MDGTAIGFPLVVTWLAVGNGDSVSIGEVVVIGLTGPRAGVSLRVATARRDGASATYQNELRERALTGIARRHARVHGRGADP